MGTAEYGGQQLVTPHPAQSPDTPIPALCQTPVCEYSTNMFILPHMYLPKFDSI